MNAPDFDNSGMSTLSNLHSQPRAARERRRSGRLGESPKSPLPAVAFRDPRGMVLLDAPNITTILYHANGRRPDAAVNAVRLVELRRSLVTRYSIKRCYYVVAAKNGFDRSARRRYVRRCHWRFVEARTPSMLNRDPADVFIIEKIQAAKSQMSEDQPRTIVLVSHDGGFADVCGGFLKSGGRLVLAGFVGSFARSLYALRSHASCQILDLRHDLGAVTPAAPASTRPANTPRRPLSDEEASLRHGGHR